MKKVTDSIKESTILERQRKMKDRCTGFVFLDASLRIVLYQYLHRFISVLPLALLPIILQK